MEIEQAVAAANEGMSARRFSYIVQNRLIFWTVPLMAMLEEDLAMLAFMFC